MAKLVPYILYPEYEPSDYLISCSECDSNYTIEEVKELNECPFCHVVWDRKGEILC